MRYDDAKALLDAIQGDDVTWEPSSWESDFLDSIEERLDKQENLSEKQGNVLQNIYRKSQGG